VRERSSLPELAGFVHTEHAGLLLQYGHLPEATQLLASLPAPQSDHLRAELLVMRARAARAAGDTAQALQYAREARDAALQAVAPVSYFAAAAELAEACDSLNGRTQAYGALATAWANLADLLGEPVARSWVEPLLLAYRMKWGDAEFTAARQGYESARKSAGGASHG
jgi:hypothetical protein